MRRVEQDIQKTVVAHLRQRGVRGLVFFHVPNGVSFGNRKAFIQGAIGKGMGVRAGVSDLILVHAGKIFALELKAPGGRPTETQLEFLADMDRQGAFTALAEGLDRALACLEAWGLLRGRTHMERKAEDAASDPQQGQQREFVRQCAGGRWGP